MELFAFLTSIVGAFLAGMHTERWAADPTPCKQCGMPKGQHRPLVCMWRAVTGTAS